LIFDGFPLTFGQADDLDTWFAGRSGALDAAIYFNMKESHASKRLESRLICSCGMMYSASVGVKPLCGVCGSTPVRREDDKPEIIKRRIMVYRDQTEPLLSHYRSNGILMEINAEQPQGAVTVQIAAALKSIL